jgi:hypothetical protein
MTQFKNSLSLFSITLIVLLCKVFDSKAQDFSYVYIQGDKKTPIYTKVEGVMMPRYGKNYALLARLAPGPMNVEILFQQNEYPPIQFNILVPENGKRAFVLQKKGEAFSLYDVEQNFYLNTNNDITEDHIPTTLNNADIAIKNPIESNLEVTVEAAKEEIKIDTTTPNISSNEPVNVDVPFTSKVTDSVSISKKTETAIVTEVPATDSSKPKFISNIIFDNSTTSSTDAPTNNTPLTETAAEAKESTTPTIVNSDCNSPIPPSNFARLYNSINTKRTENEQLGLILESTKQYCFSTQQCQRMIEKLESDIAKFTAIKSLYPKTTDQSNFVQLEELLTNTEWKEYFRELVQH